MHTAPSVWVARACSIAGIAAQAAALCLASAGVVITCARVICTARALMRQLP